MLPVPVDKKRAQSHVFELWMAGLRRYQLTKILRLIKKSMQFPAITEVVFACVYLHRKVSERADIMIRQSWQSVLTGKQQLIMLWLAQYHLLRRMIQDHFPTGAIKN